MASQQAAAEASQAYAAMAHHRVTSAHTLESSNSQHSRQNSSHNKKRRSEITIEPKKHVPSQRSQPLILRPSQASPQAWQLKEAEKENPRTTKGYNKKQGLILQAHEDGLKKRTVASAGGLGELIRPKKDRELLIANASPPGLPKPGKKSPAHIQKTQAQQETTKSQPVETEDVDQQTECARFISKKNPHEIVRERQKKEQLFMFATYDALADPTVFRQVLQQLPSENSFPQEMCQLVVKDFELCFGSSPLSPHQGKGQSAQHGYESGGFPEFEESQVPQNAPEVKPFARKAKGQVMFVQAYLLPLDQLLELICHLTGASRCEVLIPAKFSFKQPLKLQTPRTSFYDCLSKLSPFESLDVLCLTRGGSQLGGPESVLTEGLVPPKALLRTLFATYAHVFRVNQTEHTLLYYLYKLEQVRRHYQMLDLVQVVAAPLLQQAHLMKQEEPTLVDEQNQSLCESPQRLPLTAQMESPELAFKQGHASGQPFKISLLEMPLDLGSAEKGAGTNGLVSQDYTPVAMAQSEHKVHPLRKACQAEQRLSLQTLNKSYMQKSQASLNLNCQSREQVQEALSMASERKFGLGGNIVAGVGKPAMGGGLASFSRNSLSQSGYGLGVQSELSAFGNCRFNASNLSLSLHGNNSILGAPGGRGAAQLMNNLGQNSPKRLTANDFAGQPTDLCASPYGRPSLKGQYQQQQKAERRNTNKY